MRTEFSRQQLLANVFKVPGCRFAGCERFQSLANKLTLLVRLEIGPLGAKIKVMSFFNEASANLNDVGKILAAPVWRVLVSVKH